MHSQRLQGHAEVEAAMTFGKIRQETCEDGTVSHQHGGVEGVARSLVAEKRKSPGQGKMRKERGRCKENLVRAVAQKALVKKF